MQFWGLNPGHCICSASSLTLSFIPSLEFFFFQGRFISSFLFSYSLITYLYQYGLVCILHFEFQVSIVQFNLFLNLFLFSSPAPEPLRFFWFHFQKPMSECQNACCNPGYITHLWHSWVTCHSLHSILGFPDLLADFAFFVNFCSMGLNA
jgi:hypothetical protein